MPPAYPVASNPGAPSGLADVLSTVEEPAPHLLPHHPGAGPELGGPTRPRPWVLSASGATTATGPKMSSAQRPQVPRRSALAAASTRRTVSRRHTPPGVGHRHDRGGRRRRLGRAATHGDPHLFLASVAPPGPWQGVDRIDTSPPRCLALEVVAVGSATQLGRDAPAGMAAISVLTVPGRGGRSGPHIADAPTGGVNAPPPVRRGRAAHPATSQWRNRRPRPGGRPARRGHRRRRHVERRPPVPVPGSAPAGGGVDHEVHGAATLATASMQLQTDSAAASSCRRSGPEERPARTSRRSAAPLVRNASAVALDTGGSARNWLARSGRPPASQAWPATSTRTEIISWQTARADLRMGPDHRDRVGKAVRLEHGPDEREQHLLVK